MLEWKEKKILTRNEKSVSACMFSHKGYYMWLHKVQCTVQFGDLKTQPTESTLPVKDVKTQDKIILVKFNRYHLGMYCLQAF